MGRWSGGSSRKPLVSVLCATYNHQRFLASALAGFLNQATTFPFEIIFRDDGSSDGTVADLKKYQTEYPSLIRLILEPQNTFNISSPVQEMRRRSNAKYVAICDGDDFWVQDDKLQRQFDFLESNPRVVLSHHGGVVVDQAGYEIETLPSPEDRKSLPSSQARYGFRFLQSTVFYRNIEIPWIRYPPTEALSNDVITGQLLALRGDTAFIPDFYGTVRRIHGENSGSARGLDETSGRVKALTSRIYLSQILLEQGEPKIAEHFLAEAAFRAITLFQSSGTSPIKVLLRMVVKFIFVGQIAKAILTFQKKFPSKIQRGSQNKWWSQEMQG